MLLDYLVIKRDRRAERERKRVRDREKEREGKRKKRRKYETTRFFKTNKKG